MKKNLALTVTGLFCLFVSCKDSGTTSMADPNQKNLDINAKIIKAIETGDAETINSLIADDVVDHMGPSGKEIKGGDSLKPMLIDMHNHMKDLKFDIITTSANADYVFTLSKITGTAIDASMGMPAGTVMNENVVDLVKIKDGKVIEHWSYTDPTVMMKQMNESSSMNKKMDSIKAK
ncbi:ester cyclase [Flavobacterium aestivum]|uniref:ester cyclase n=1 Tax=Flavobacterium aestivum TaxID=3003257 RepID=UPI0022856A19|nr:ester cyclase [Flavobacterium aestivum]